MPEEEVDRLPRLALLAPPDTTPSLEPSSWSATPTGAPAWPSWVLRGAAAYSAANRPPRRGRDPEEHARRAAGYAETALGGHREVPVGSGR